ncbi:MFS transporter [Chitinilyticum litopenaei]|uniref:MFS transporter n=1 Tax=Chitinilyticum litopenaei TaxID=1121276 RepID=UPI00040815F4|nr:MFS transporter [Chitinilyticum litopenaei]
MNAAQSRGWLAYGVLGMPLAMVALPLYVTAPRFYNHEFGLALALTGAAILVARLFDTVQDPLLGRWLDRRPAHATAARWGGALLMPLGLLALFAPPALPGPALAVWLCLSLVAIALGHSLITLPYLALAGRLAADASASDRFNASREGFGLLGVLLASATLPAVLQAGPHWQAPALLLLGLLLLAGVLLLPRQAGSGEDSSRQSGKELVEKSGVWPTDPTLIKFLAIYLVNALSAALPATLAPFFIADVLAAEAWTGPLLALYFLAAVLLLSLWVRLAARFGRLRVWLAGMLLTVLVFLPVPWLAAGDVAIFAVICVLSGALLGADLALPPAMLGALAGRELLTQRYGWWSLCGKLALALAVGVSLPLLQLLGYSSSAKTGLLALAICYAALPCTMKLLAAALLWRWQSALAAADGGDHAGGGEIAGAGPANGNHGRNPLTGATS